MSATCAIPNARAKKTWARATRGQVFLENENRNANKNTNGVSGAQVRSRLKATPAACARVIGEPELLYAQ